MLVSNITHNNRPESVVCSVCMYYMSRRADQKAKGAYTYIVPSEKQTSVASCCIGTVKIRSFKVKIGHR